MKTCLPGLSIYSSEFLFSMSAHIRTQRQSRQKKNKNKKHERAYLCPKPGSSKGSDNREEAPTLSSILPGSVPKRGPSGPPPHPDPPPACPALRQPTSSLNLQSGKDKSFRLPDSWDHLFQIILRSPNVYNLSPKQQPTHRDPAPSSKLDLDCLPEHFRALPLPVNLLTLFRNWNA